MVEPSALIRWEWAIMFGIAIGLALWELRSVRRAMREPERGAVAKGPVRGVTGEKEGPRPAQCAGAPMNPP